MVNAVLQTIGDDRTCSIRMNSSVAPRSGFSASWRNPSCWSRWCQQYEPASNIVTHTSDGTLSLPSTLYTGMWLVRCISYCLPDSFLLAVRLLCMLLTQKKATVIFDVCWYTFTIISWTHGAACWRKCRLLMFSVCPNSEEFKHSLRSHARSHDIYRNFCSACTVTLSFSNTLIVLFYLLTYLLTYSLGCIRDLFLRATAYML